MKRFLAVALLAGAVSAVPAASAAVAPVEIVDLVTDPAAWDGTEVEVRGEMVGDFGRRDGEVWVQLNGDPYVDAPILDGGDLAGANVGIGARIPDEVFGPGGFGDAGGYRHRGAVILATGVWRHHDDQRSGESYLDVTSLTVELPEQPLEEGADPWALGIGLGLLSLAAVVEGGNRARRRLP